MTEGTEGTRSEAHAEAGGRRLVVEAQEEGSGWGSGVWIGIWKFWNFGLEFGYYNLAFWSRLGSCNLKEILHERFSFQ